MAMRPTLRRRRRRAAQPMAEINVTPLVDVMLVLLIIFMVTAPLLVTGVPVNLPDSRAGALDQKQQPVQISIDDRGRGPLSTIRRLWQACCRSGWRRSPPGEGGRERQVLSARRHQPRLRQGDGRDGRAQSRRAEQGGAGLDGSQDGRVTRVSMDRAERTGIGLVGGGACRPVRRVVLGLFAGRNKMPSQNQPLDVQFVDNVGLSAAAPKVSTEASAPVRRAASRGRRRMQPLRPRPPRPSRRRPSRRQPPKPAPKPSPSPRRRSPSPPSRRRPRSRPKPSLATRRGLPQEHQDASHERGKSAAAEAKKARGARLGPDFLKGSRRDGRANTPPAAISGAAQASSRAAIREQLARYWVPPSGPIGGLRTSLPRPPQPGRQHRRPARGDRPDRHHGCQPRLCPPACRRPPSAPSTRPAPLKLPRDILRLLATARAAQFRRDAGAMTTMITGETPMPRLKSSSCSRLRCWPLPATAQLRVDVDRGIPQPMPIAIPIMPPRVPMQTPAGETTALGRQIAQIVTDDLKGSGLLPPRRPIRRRSACSRWTRPIIHTGRTRARRRWCRASSRPMATARSSSAAISTTCSRRPSWRGRASRCAPSNGGAARAQMRRRGLFAPDRRGPLFRQPRRLCLGDGPKNNHG